MWAQSTQKWNVNRKVAVWLAIECEKDSNKSISLNFKLILVVCEVTFILTEQIRTKPLLHYNQHRFRPVLNKSICKMKCGAKKQSRFELRELHMTCPTSQILYHSNITKIKREKKRTTTSYSGKWADRLDRWYDNAVCWCSLQFAIQIVFGFEYV